MKRIEKDALGQLEVNETSYHGIFTERAKKNFQISGIKAKGSFLTGLAIIKKSAAKTNSQLGVLDEKIAEAITKAADEIIEGKHRNEFPLDVFQAGAGTPFNMNMNEVLANLAIETLGGKKGEYNIVHPNNHVNMAQSSNDVIPTAFRLAILFESEKLLTSLSSITKSLSKVALQHENTIKAGRTHLQDAVPVTFAQVFNSYTFSLNKCIDSIIKSRADLQELGIGGTAIGTGINTHPKFKKTIAKELEKETGYELRIAEDTIATTWSMAAFIEYSSSLRMLAVELSKICDDLMLMNSGPKTGISEITLPEVEPGSSIMPGKVNPSVPECMKMICFQAIGNDLAVMEAAKSGNLELNVYAPVIGQNLLFSTEILANGINMLSELCIEPIIINRERAEKLAENSLIIATALNPYIGYDAAAELVKKSLNENKPIKEIIMENNIIDEKHLSTILDTKKMTQPAIVDKELVQIIRKSENFKRFFQIN